jgi:hypothetical protein
MWMSIAPPTSDLFGHQLIGAAQSRSASSDDVVRDKSVSFNRYSMRRLRRDTAGILRMRIQPAPIDTMKN